ncbi:SufE family protein [Flavobacterium pectinovorum]|uniref:SufE family protein n=1 Tax=Flavobacterium pectinovorum TaxID=29533 RepID=A0A502EEQ0_9FLAO|nr:SufE family protein [Flavobacterium pectinovorum]TPG36148.1 SufE family protein [Flavobacterium pectinovorum]
MTINQLQDDLIEQFSKSGNNFSDKYKLIIQMGKALQEMDVAFRTDENRIWSCQATVWVHSIERDGKLYIQADSDAAITKGLIALILYVLSGKRKQDIANANLYFIDKIHLKEYLSPNKSNGILAMIKDIQILAAEGKLVGPRSCSI